MKVVIAIDSFKGSLSSVAAGEAAAQGVRRVFPDAVCEVRPLADGGEGTVDALVSGLGGTFVTCVVPGPLGDLVAARYGLLPNGVAIMEMAEAAGITRVARDQRKALITSTYGVGAMIRHAVQRGATRIIMGIGGSATNDGGAGMLQALGFKLRDKDGRDLARGGAALADLSTIELSTVDVQFRVACDVTNPLCGPTGASVVFGPQKGASPADVKVLDAALAHFAHVAALTMGRDDASVPGAGAAGGLGFAFKSFLGGELVPGVDLILEETKLADTLADADLVITGEGCLDAQTVMGKAPIGVARLAKKKGLPVLAFSGCLGAGATAVNAAGIDAYFPIVPRVMPLADALNVTRAAANLSATVEQACRLLKVGGFSL